MAIQVRVISDDDWNVLKRIVEVNRNLLQNTPNRPSTNSQNQDGDDSMSPEVYIALPPVDGIPARSGVTPGVAVCEIYRISRGQLIAVSGVTKRVYNFSETVIEQEYITIKRDKFGTWLPLVGGSGGGYTIRFTIVSEGDCGGWLVSIDSRVCGSGTLPGEHSGYLIAYAVLSCIEPAIGMTGYAQYMIGASTYCETGTGSGTPEESSCRWEMTALCC